MKRLFLITTLLVSGLDAQTDPDTVRRTQWFRDAKFGMLITWGLYSIPAGEWKGKEYPGIGEWIMNWAHIPVAEYAQLAPQFNPVKFNADEWAALAKEAGMKYVVPMPKHMTSAFCGGRSRKARGKCAITFVMGVRIVMP